MVCTGTTIPLVVVRILLLDFLDYDRQFGCVLLICTIHDIALIVCIIRVNVQVVLTIIVHIVFLGIWTIMAGVLHMLAHLLLVLMDGIMMLLLPKIFYIVL